MASRALYVNPDTGEVVAKNLNVSGTSTIVDTYTTVSSNISLMNLSGTGPALRVAQTGVGAGYPVADFYDNDVSTTVPALRIADGGNVGIGTANPLGTLHVNGSLVTSASDGVVRKYSTYINATTWGTIKIGEFTFSGSSHNMHIKGVITGQSGANGSVVDFEALCRSNTLPSKTIVIVQTTKRLPYNITFRLWEDASSGRVVLGFTPSGTLQSFGWDLTIFERSNYNTFENENSFVEVDTTGLTELPVTTSITTDATGNVGIGTTNPKTKLEVFGDNDTLILRNTSLKYTGGSSSILFKNNSADDQYPLARISAVDSQTVVNTVYKGDLVLSTGFNAGLNERMRIASEGNVGIGTTNPQAKLHIVGYLRMSSPIAFRMTNITSFSVANNTPTLVQLTYAPISCTGVDTTNSKFTVPVAGLYFISSRVDTACFTGSIGMSAYIHINGTAVMNTGGYSNASNRHFVIQSVFSLNVNDTITLIIYQSSGSTITSTTNGSGWSHEMIGNLIG